MERLGRVEDRRVDVDASADVLLREEQGTEALGQYGDARAAIFYASV